MKQILILAALFTISIAQFPQGHFPNVPGVTPPPWRGPLADHMIGVPPKDTPEVASAKNALNHAYSQVLAVLPELPPEERYNPRQDSHLPVPSHIPQHLPIPQHIPQFGHPASVTPVKSFAEQVPRSAIGEVPEVHAAREAHLKAFQDVASKLPRLAETRFQTPTAHVQNVVPQHPGFAFQNPAHHAVQDTPEVARAKAEHAAAVAAARG